MRGASDRRRRHRLAARVRRILQSRAVDLLQMFERKGLLPRTLLFRVALGQLDAVRALLGEDAYDLTALNDAFICACRFEHEAVASLLLERAIAIDPERQVLH